MYITANIKNYRPDLFCKKTYNFLKSCKYNFTKSYKQKFPLLTFQFYLFLVSCLLNYLKGGFSPHEIFSLGLKSSFRSNEYMSQFISYRKLNARVKSLNLNPQNWTCLASNKDIFYKLCKNVGLPIPEMYATIFKNKTAISYLTSSFIKKEKLIEFFREGLPYEFVVKPTDGCQGRFINVYTKTNNGLVDGFGNLRTEQEVLHDIVNNKIYQSFVVQERLRNHDDLLKIHPSENLHSIRIITLIDSSGRFKILHGHLNIGTGSNLAAQQGDIKALIALKSGSLEYAIYFDRKNGGVKKITKHPETGRDFTQCKIPIWKEILSLTEKAALEFLPLRTLGWDFAITDKGIKLLEVNIAYTSPNFFAPNVRIKDAFFGSKLQ